MNKLYFLFGILFFQAGILKAQWGEGDSRTETRDNAGSQGDAGAKSGFYQTVNPINFPTGAQGWWHLLDIRHSSTTNNYAMQFSGNFYDQNLYFRKTAGAANQPWSQVLTANSDGNLNNGKIAVYSASGGSFFTGHQAGATYSYPSGLFHAVTDNPNGSVNYFYDGTTNGTTNFYVRADGQGYFGGNVGIGTNTNANTPNANLEVNGTFAVAGNFSNLDSRMPNRNLSFLEGSGKMLIGWNRTAGAGETDFIGNQGGGTVGGFAFYDHSNTGVEKQLMWLTADGRLFVGLNDVGGSSTGNNKLAVGGGIIGESVTVKLQGNWPDYVFRKDYALPDLRDVNHYIFKNHHLPEMPSEKEIAENGLNLGEMNKLLVKKVEELTLYLIEKDKEVKAQKLRMEKIQEQLIQMNETMMIMQKQIKSSSKK